MAILLVVNNPDTWPLKVRGVRLVSADKYLADPSFNAMRGVKVFNLCRSYAYQSAGYYVSLLAEARGHRPHPSVTTIQDLKSVGLVRALTDELHDLIQGSLHSLRSREFTFSIYFGRNPAERYGQLARKLYSLFPVPLLRAEFARTDKGVWELRYINAISLRNVSEGHFPFVLQATREYFSKGRWTNGVVHQPRFDLAVLYDPDEKEPPSDAKALKRFQKAAQRLGFGVEFIGKDDIERLNEFDALFIRVTTHVTHYTYRFSRRAAAEGLVVIDDPTSIARCVNKVYMMQRLGNNHVPIPKSLIVHQDNIDEVAPTVGLPCVLKQPDSSFSHGVVRVDDEKTLHAEIARLLDKSDLILAQEYLPTDYDWRVGIIDGRPLFACRYFMAPAHWQIINHRADEDGRYGKVETIPWELAPKRVVKTALKAAKLMGNGLYGVDLKQIGKQCVVMEVNDNPTIQSSFEDAVLEDALYERIMHVFLQRLEQQKAGIP
jgi:glutathione synthase/RimK-type ligase-like ATP-grasp enzyme